MTTAMDIRQEMVLRAPRETVWKALTTPEGWTGWFSSQVEGNFQVGEIMILDFGPDTRCYGKVVERVENSSFAYRWHPGEDCPMDKYPEDQMTTVRFSLAEHPDGTLLTVVETGFENIPESRRANCVKLNTEGWAWELEELQAFVEHGVKQSKANAESPTTES